jgi:hypothetical protein
LFVAFHVTQRRQRRAHGRGWVLTLDHTYRGATMQRAARLLLLAAVCCAISVNALPGSSTQGLEELAWRVSNANGSIVLNTQLVRPPAAPAALTAVRMRF